MVYPPRPNNITIPAVVAGNILQSDDTSISVIDAGNDGAIVMRTQNKPAIIVNPSQQSLFNTENAFGMVNVNSDVSTTPQIRLSYQDNVYYDFSLSNTAIRFTPSADDPNITKVMSTEFDNDVNIDDHDGSTKGLKLGGMLITASATELNYVDVPAGTAVANKALVLDNNKNIQTINRLDANLVSGTLLTSYQPNITTLHTINIENKLYIQGVAFDIDLRTLQYLQLPNLQTGVAVASKALVVDDNRNIANINSLSATTLSGTLTAGPQPNITALSSLNSLNNNGFTQLHNTTTITSSDNTQLVLGYDSNRISTLTTNYYGDLVISANSSLVKIDGGSLHISGHNGSTQGLILGTNLVIATAAQLNSTAVSMGTAAAYKALILDINKEIRGINYLETNTLSGQLVSPSQPYISSVNTLNIASHNGSTGGLALSGILVTASAIELNYVDVPAGVAQASKALVLNPSRSITGIGNLGADTLSGVITTPTQPYINTVTTLNITNHNGTNTGLALAGTLVLASAQELNTTKVSPGVATAGKALVLNDGGDVSGINTLGATNINGTVRTGSQPYITQVNSLNIAGHNTTTTGLSLNGTLITASAAEINYIDVEPGFSAPRKALVLDVSGSITGINSLTASSLQGRIITSDQPNITQVNTLNIANHNASTTGLALAGELLTVSAYQINTLNVGAGNGTALKALVLDGSRSISNINTLTAVSIFGEIQSSSQPKITSVSYLNIADHNGSTNGLSLAGTLVQATAAQINYLMIDTLGQAQANRVVTANAIKNIEGINALYATTLSGTLITSNQPNISQVNTLNIANHNGTIGLSLAGNIVTATADQINRLNTNAGTAQAGKVMVVDTLRNIVNVNSLEASLLTGTLQTAIQPNISQVNTLNISNHDGGSTGLQLRGTLVSATANQLNYNVVTAGTASPSRALVVDAFTSIAGINNLTAQQITASKLNLSGIIANFNTGALVIKSYSFTNLIGRMIGTQLLTSLQFSNFVPADNVSSGYSSEIIGYIMPPSSQNYTFYITCNDRVRIWVNGTLVLHSWVATTNMRTSTSIFLNANQWVPIYIQYQVDVGSIPTFNLQWASGAFTRTDILSSQLAWDNNSSSVAKNIVSQDTFMIYNTNTTSQNTASFKVDTAGDLTIDASGNDIVLGPQDNLNIPAHDGSTSGLMLGGVLVRPTAFELNYLKVNPGIVGASQALVVDASKSLTGINSLTATSIACGNLTADAFSISNLSLSGPLNNYNSGSLIIRQITGPNCGGRVVNVDTISDLNFNSYDPRSLNLNYSIDISGYINPASSDTYKFYATGSGYIRIWINNVLVLNAWGSTTNVEYQSNQIQLTQGRWVPIYIQFQNLSTGSTTIQSALQIQWSTTLMAKQFINSTNMAWDNTTVSAARSLSGPDQITLYNSSSGLTTPQTATIAVNINGDMNLSCASTTVNVASANDFNIVSHGNGKGLRLGGTLVAASAAELNYLSGASPGLAIAGKAVILNDSGVLTGFDILGATSLQGTIATAAQPNIRSIGTLNSTLTTNSDFVINSTNALRLSADATACYVQAGNATTANAASDIFIGNYATTIAASTRKLMIKANGNVGIQTSSPTRTLTINGGGSPFCLRLVNNSSDGSDANYIDVGVDSSSNLVLGSTGAGSATIGVSTAGIMKIIPSGGSLQIGNTSNNSLPIEIGSANFSVGSTVGYLNSAGSVGTTVPADVSYSLRTTGSIIVNGTVCITSDRRLKEDIRPLDAATCKRFIMESDPVQFIYKSDPCKRTHCGLIAQEVAKTDFVQLVNPSPCQGLEEDCRDGFISPADASLSVSYEEIVPILMTTLKEVVSENETLKQQMQYMISKMKELEDRLDQSNC
jgi:PA14 domain/Chaperone of endosialidase